METAIENDLRKAFVYDPETGSLTWATRASNRVRDDLSAGYVNDKGYHSVYFGGRNYPAHRIAWLLHYGQFPTGQIDHINGIRGDNRIANLRDVPSSENQKNTRLDKRNKSGVSGVRWRDDRSCWEASIRVAGKLIQLGRFQEMSVAIAARKDAERLYGFHENHGLMAGKKGER